ncbi:Golgi transport complex subunit 6, partial [Quaeritorhiza haematococci]
MTSVTAAANPASTTNTPTSAVASGPYGTSIQQPQPQNKLAKTNPLARKLQKVLNTSLEDPQTQDALEALAEFYTANSLTARRNLRGDVEKRVMAVNGKFKDAFGLVNEQLEAIEREVEQMNKSCVEMEEKLDTAKSQTTQLIRRTEELKMKKFTLSDQEILALVSPNAEVGPTFFQALRHLHQINEDCRALLVTEHQRAGLEIMENMAQYQETAYEKLFRWTQAECRTLNRESPEVTHLLKEGMKALKQRPVLFQTCVDEISNIRRNAIVRSFLDALTRGGPGGTPRPIEMHAHDPLRYIGDMLAWVHQAVAGEREILEGLLDVRISAALLSASVHSPTSHSGTGSARASVFKDSPSPSLVPSTTPGGADGEGPILETDDVIVLRILDRNMEGVCRPLKVRVEQVLASQPGAITCYRVSNLIQFYATTIVKAMGARAHLSAVLQDISEMSVKLFFDTLNAQASRLLRFVQTPGPDLRPPPAVKETVTQLKEILSSYDSSLLNPEDRDREVTNIVSAVVDPLLQMCVLGSAKLGSSENAVYMVNCLHSIASALAAYPFAGAQVQVFESQIDAQVEVLTVEQYQILLKQSGLAPIVAAVHSNEQKDKKDRTPLSLLPNMDSKSISVAVTKLDTFLFTI